MRYWLALVGVACAAATNHWFPTITAELIAVPGFVAGFNALGAALTASWAASLTKLTSFDKIEDLPAVSRKTLMGFVRSYRLRIIAAILSNTLLLVLLTGIVFLSQASSLKGPALAPYMSYVLLITLWFWIGGCLDSWLCYQALDRSREEFAIAQIELKKRAAYLAKLRKDAMDAPVSRDDAHLNGYTSASAKP
jgi:hypothetical protein